MPYLFNETLFDSFTQDVQNKFKDFNIIYGKNIENFDQNKLVLRNKKSISRSQSHNFNLFFSNITNTCIGRNGSGVSKSYVLQGIKKAMGKAKLQDTAMHEAASSMYKYDILFITKKKKYPRPKK